MAKYVIEIGLDSDIGPRPDGTYPHLVSLAGVTDWPPEKPPQGAGTPCWFTNFQRDDQFVFRVCDYTKGASKSSKLDVKSLDVVFLDIKKPRHLAPRLKESFVVTGQQYFPERGWNSVVIPGAPGWRFITNEGGESILSFSDVFEGETRALLRVSVAATCPDPDPATGSLGMELRWYIHDPEIIVGVGGDGSYESSRRRTSSPRRR